MPARSQQPRATQPAVLRFATAFVGYGYYPGAVPVAVRRPRRSGAGCRSTPSTATPPLPCGFGWSRRPSQPLSLRVARSWLPASPLVPFAGLRPSRLFAVPALLSFGRRRDSHHPPVPAVFGGPVLRLLCVPCPRICPLFGPAGSDSQPIVCQPPAGVPLVPLPSYVPLCHGPRCVSLLSSCLSPVVLIHRLRSRPTYGEVRLALRSVPMCLPSVSSNQQFGLGRSA